MLFCRQVLIREAVSTGRCTIVVRAACWAAGTRVVALDSERKRANATIGRSA